MEMSLMLLEQILAMVLMALAGFAAAKLRLISGEESRVLSQISVYIVAPCSLIDAFQTEFEAEKLTGIWWPDWRP